MAQTAEVVIIGGGIIGASIAYHLRQDGLSGRLIVVERDTTYSRATTPMSMGGVRQQYAAPCNIALARYSLQFYEQFDEMMVGGWGRPQAHFHQCGYLFLFDETQRPAIMQKYQVQRQMGVVKNCVAGYRELIAANIAVVLAALHQLRHAFPFAARTLNAMWPAQISKICAAFFIRSERLNEVDQVYV